MPYCQHCGGPLAEAEPAPEIIETIPATNAAEVEIARIQAERDIRLAKIAAGTIDAEQEIAVAEAEARADAAEAVVEILAPEPDPAPEPIVITDDGDGDDLDDGNAPPPLGDDSGPPPEPAKSSLSWY